MLYTVFMVSSASSKAFMDILFPPLCPLCALDVEASSRGLCERCAGLFAEELISGPLCLLCGNPFKGLAANDHTCGACIKKPPHFLKARSPYLYEGEVRRAVHELKYRWSTKLGPFLGRVMAGAAIKMDFIADMVVPVPLHKSKIRKRGFNQSVVLARQMAKALSTKLNITNLVRSRPTLPQVGLVREQRAKNVAGAFALREAKLFQYRSILLVDDVLTTGATVGECAKVLKKAGARVAVITLARVVL